MVEKIWREYYNQLLRFIQKRVSDPSLAEDILQEVFIKIYSSIDSLQETRKIKAWLYQITRNTIIDYYRKNHPESEMPESLMEMAEEQHSAMEDLHGCIMPMINSIPETYREALILSELNGLTQKEVAEKLNISYSGAKSRVQRGRVLLKEALAHCCRFEYDSRGNVVDYEKKSPHCPSCRNHSC